MKFTPETLLQIYLNGAFTDEAQAEFDKLMRQDPVFVEKVTQALADRLGPVPEDVVNGVAARLDGKIGDLWKSHKPSPMGRFLKFGFGTAVALTAVGGMFFGGRHILAKLNVPAISETSNSGKPSLSTSKQVVGQKVSNPKTKGTLVKKSHSGTGGIHFTMASSVPESSTSSAGLGQNPSGTGNGSMAAQKYRPSGLNTGKQGNGVVILPPASAANQNSIGALSTSPAGNPALASKPPARGVTSEGNSLRVAIDTDKTENVDVTVYDANGLLIRHLYNGVLPAGEHYVDWDGNDQLGNAVLPGDYTVILDRGGKKMSGILQVLPNR